MSGDKEPTPAVDLTHDGYPVFSTASATRRNSLLRFTM